MRGWVVFLLLATTTYAASSTSLPTSPPTAWHWIGLGVTVGLIGAGAVVYFLGAQTRVGRENERALLISMTGGAEPGSEAPPKSSCPCFSAPQEEVVPSTSNSILAFEALLLHKRLRLVKAVYLVVENRDIDAMARNLVSLFEYRVLTLRLFNSCIDFEVRGTENSNTLLRSNSLLTKMFSVYTRLIGQEWLASILKEHVNAILANPNGYEIQPDKLGGEINPETIEANALNLQTLCGNFLNSITNGTDNCPLHLREICGHLYKEVKDSKIHHDKRYQMVGNFLMLRFLGPAIVSPETFGLVEESPSPEARRVLVLVSKTLQSIANGTTTGDASYMSVLAEFQKTNIHPWKKFIQVFCRKIPSLELYNQDNVDKPLNHEPFTTEAEKTAALKGLYEWMKPRMPDMEMALFTLQKEKVALKPSGGTLKERLSPGGDDFSDMTSINTVGSTSSTITLASTAGGTVGRTRVDKTLVKLTDLMSELEGAFPDPPPPPAGALNKVRARLASMGGDRPVNRERNGSGGSTGSKSRKRSSAGRLSVGRGDEPRRRGKSLTASDLAKVKDVVAPALAEYYGETPDGAKHSSKGSKNRKSKSSRGSNSRKRSNSQSPSRSPGRRIGAAGRAVLEAQTNGGDDDQVGAGLTPVILVSSTATSPPPGTTIGEDLEPGEISPEMIRAANDQEPLTTIIVSGRSRSRSRSGSIKKKRKGSKHRKKSAAGKKDNSL